MKRPSKWTWLWIGWLVAFVVLEITAARSKRPKPRTLSEHLWKWFRRPWRRVILVGLLGLLFWHLAAGPDLKPFTEPWTP